MVLKRMLSLAWLDRAGYDAAITQPLPAPGPDK